MDRERTIAIIEPERVLEIWEWTLLHPTDCKEREEELGKTVESRVTERGQECRDVFRYQRSRQQWGHYAIRRYGARKLESRLPYWAMAAMLGGIVLIVVATTELWGKIPLAAILAGVALLIAGSVLIVLAGKSISVAAPPYHVVSLESLGVSAKLLGFSADARAATAIPHGYARGPMTNKLELDAPIGDWELAEQYSVTDNWYPCT